MKIYIFGLGYVGVVTAACLCKQGHDVTGVDVSMFKVDALNRGESPIVEDMIAELVASGVQSGRLRGIAVPDGVEESDLCITCVGTPSEENGELCTRYVEAVMDDIGSRLGGRRHTLPVVVRSTMLPGTMRSLVVPRLEAASGSPAGGKFEAVYHPEFLREGSSVQDYFDPPKIVVGERVPGAGDRLMELYGGFEAPVVCTSYETAEMVKYSDNIFHALKITFANEIGQLCQAHGCDSQEVMHVFCKDTKLNISPKYLRPGYAFGGSCLPKDLRAMLHAGRRRDVAAPMLNAVLESNRMQVERAVRLVLSGAPKTVGLVGLAFKPGTDDLRESPLVTLAERLYGKGVGLLIHDGFVRIAGLVGGNKAYVQQRLPHLARLLVSNVADLATCDTIVVGHPMELSCVQEFLDEGKKVIDLTGLGPAPVGSGYRAIV